MPRLPRSAVAPAAALIMIAGPHVADAKGNQNVATDPVAGRCGSTTRTADRPPTDAAQVATKFRFEIVACEATKARQYIRFVRSLKKFSSRQTELGKKYLSAGTVLTGLPRTGATACQPEGNGVGAVGPGTQASRGFAQAIKVFDQMALDYDAMKRAFDAGAYEGTMVKLSIGDALAAIDTGLKQTNKGLITVKAAADAYANADCEAGDNLMNSGSLSWTEGQQAVIFAAAKIYSLDAQLKESCVGAADVLAPLSKADVDNASGGGGAQRKSSNGLAVLAPQRLHLQRRGRAALPLTLTTPAAGDVTLELTSGGTKIVSIVASTGRGVGGVKLNLPARTPKGASRLIVTFTPTTALSPTATIRETIRIS